MTASARLLARTLDRRSSNLQPPVPSKPARVPVASATSRNENLMRTETKPASTTRKTRDAAASIGRSTKSTSALSARSARSESGATRRAGTETLDALLRAVRACHVCAAQLPLGPRPVLQIGASARILIVGQAPGAKVHASGIPWSDASGERLRTWMGIAASVFYDESRIAILPMGFCYPGRGASGDRPPRRECAPLWHDRLLAQMTHIELTLLVGGYAQAHFLERAGHTSLTATMRDWRRLAPRIIPLPHPSPRNVAWFKANPWFEGEVLPQLQRSVRRLIATRHA